MRILGPSTVSYSRASLWMRDKGAPERFVNLAYFYWRLAPLVGVRPEVAYAQSAVETGFGRFGGVIKPSFHNPCGLKTVLGGPDTDPEAHQRFETWEVGIQAHLDHLALYAGAYGYPKKQTFDPRHFKTLLGRAKDSVNPGLDTWASAPDYGQKIEGLVRRLDSAADIRRG